MTTRDNDCGDGGHTGGTHLDGYVEGTNGNDVIDSNYTGDPDGDKIDHNDNIFFGLGSNDDIVYAGGGDDVIKSGLGNDWDFGGTGNDKIYGGDGNDHLYGDSGNDALYGDAGNDVLYGGGGHDSLYGGTGHNVLFGGDDGDKFFGTGGVDTMYGGSGNDYFTGVHAGDYVNGGEGSAFCGHVEGDHDTLDLTGSGPLEVCYDPHNHENGTVNFLDGHGHITGSMTFKNIECVIPCFTPGTLIATPKGERAVEELQPGDRVITRDNGIQEIRWIGQKDMDYKALAANPHLKPILIQKGSLGNDLPERDMLVSPNHRVLVANERTALYFDEHEVLVSAKHLVNNRGVHEVSTIGTSYIHFMFDNHEVVLSNGSWTESFEPGDYTLKGMGNAQRSEIYDLFPELKTLEGLEAYGAARKTLKRHEAALLAR